MAYLGVDEWHIYQRFQNEPTQKVMAASGRQYTEKTKFLIAKTYRTDLHFTTQPKKVADKDDLSHLLNTTQISVKDELISKVELEQLKQGKKIEITYLVSSPNIFSHDGNRRDEFPWKWMGLSFLMFIVAVTSFKKSR